MFLETEDEINNATTITKSLISREALVVSQFTLATDTKKGTLSSFSSAASQIVAKQLYELFVANLKN